MNRKRREKKEENHAQNHVLKDYKEYLNYKPPDKVIFHNIKNRLPPDNGENILFFDPMYGYDIGVSSVILQHIHHDIQNLNFSRTTHWARLKIKSEEQT